MAGAAQNLWESPNRCLTLAAREAAEYFAGEPFSPVEIPHL